ncbi:MAG: glycosyltransferase family 4 protein [Anaerolineales bacterium]
MNILFVADGRSPTAINWIRHFTETGHRVHLVSTFACPPLPGLAGFDVLPVAFSGAKSASQSSDTARRMLWSAATLSLRTTLRRWLGPLTIARAADHLRKIIQSAQPDLVHAMRIPFEGMLAADALANLPLVVSVWGNDFTLHAPSTPLMRHYTRWTMQVASALHTDCRRDARLAAEWGFDPTQPVLVAPGNGGIRTDIFFPPRTLPAAPVVFNPRGFRAYVRNDNFFKAIPLVLRERPDARFVCSGMAGEPQVLRWIDELGIGAAVDLLPPIPHAEMAAHYRAAQVLVSPSTHDGTPNTLLEGMACGCLPVAGDLESIREWITDGQNGLLIDSNDPASIAAGILRGLNEPALRNQAAQLNAGLVAERAEYSRNMARAEAFYQKVINARR